MIGKVMNGVGKIPQTPTPKDTTKPNKDSIIDKMKNDSVPKKDDEIKDK
jgi:hypothetical protein